jgi:hypothetical protein
VYRTRGSWRGVAAWLIAITAVGWAACAQATATYTVTVSPGVDLGTVTSAASGDTVFRIDPSTGAVTVVSGSATRSGSGTTRALVTISCAATAPTDCNKPLNIKLGPVGSATGRARTLTHILFQLGTAILTCSPGTPATPTFCIGPIGANSSRTFYVGADFGIAGDDSGLATGLAESDVFVFAAEQPNPPTTGATGRFQANAIRGIAISKTSDLVFGSVVKPLAGSGGVTIDATSGARTATGGVVGMASPIPSRAAFNVTGEGGQAISITVPSSFTMTGPATITVSTTNTAAGSPVLSGALGAAGSYAFGVGGTAPIAAATPDGTYTGSVTVTVAYN